MKGTLKVPNPRLREKSGSDTMQYTVLNSLVPSEDFIYVKHAEQPVMAVRNGSP